MHYDGAFFLDCCLWCFVISLVSGANIWRNSLATLLWKWWKNFKLCWKGKLFVDIPGHNANPYIKMVMTQILL
ncbi:hypothetical protein BC941DRAFT_422562 [Chlamydoabsidia padenii]|nr:hypothetical protein BC941DRAFT_422562 [Chlamydoabsidia padenii]